MNLFDFFYSYAVKPRFAACVPDPQTDRGHCFFVKRSRRGKGMDFTAPLSCAVDPGFGERKSIIAAEVDIGSGAVFPLEILAAEKLWDEDLSFLEKEVAKYVTAK